MNECDNLCVAHLLRYHHFVLLACCPYVACNVCVTRSEVWVAHSVLGIA